MRRGVKFTEEHKRKIGLANSIALKGNKNHLGKKLNKEQRKRISESHKGLTYPNRKKSHHSDETKKKISIYQINKSKKYKDTSIEIKIEYLLKELGVEYEKQKPLFNIAIVDFYIPSKKLVIQCDGCYYHCCPDHYPNSHPKAKSRDSYQNMVLSQNGLKVLRFWEHDIKLMTFKLDLINKD